MSPISIAVVGRQGQVAAALAKAASGRGLRAKFAGRPDADLRDKKSLERFILGTRADLIINAAAYTGVDQAEAEPELAFQINAAGPEALARIAARRNLPLVHLSTDYVFDGSKRSPYREDDRVAPLSVYGTTKAAGEEAIRQVQSHHIILRTSWVFSETGSNFVKTMLKLAKSRDEIAVIDDQFGRPTYAADLANAILDLAPHLTQTTAEPAWGTYHIAGAGETTWYGFAREIFAHGAAAGAKVPRVRPITTADYPLPAQRPPYSVLDTTKIEKTFGIKLRPWCEGLGACMRELSPEASREYAV